MANRTNHLGFSLLETALIVLILGILGGVSWFVVHSNKSTEDQVSNIDKSAVKTKPATSKTSGQKFVFKQLGVQINLPVELKGLTSSPFSSSEGTYLGLSTPEYIDALASCEADTQGKPAFFASISKIPGQYDEDSNPGAGNLKQFKDFWISTASPNGIVCDDSASQQAKDNLSSVSQKLSSSLRSAFQSAEEVK